MVNIVVKNNTGLTKELKLGYSWTLLLFGALVPLLRQDWKHAVIFIVLNVLLDLAGIYFVAQIGMFVMSFFYNKLYARDLVDDGYRGATPQADAALTKYINSSKVF